MKCFKDKLFEWIDSNGLFAETDRVLLAVSGGADSVAMAHVLTELKNRGELSCEFVIGHVNHCLRGEESDTDEQFVISLGKRLDIPVVTTSVDVMGHTKEHKLSIETAGRQLRLKTLAKMATEHECGCVATAHHKDDLAETMIHRLMRGTGFRGLCGIWPISEVYGAEFIRPMLSLCRSEIIQYCNDNQISWREDASNRNTNFTRNKIRHHLLPILNAESDTIVDQFAILSNKSRRFLLWTEKHALSIISNGRLDRAKGQFEIDKALLAKCLPWVFYEVLREVLNKLSVGLRDYRRQHFDAIEKMIQRNRAKADFPGQVEIAVENDNVFIQVKTDSATVLPEPVALRIGHTVQFGQWKISSKLLSAEEVDIKQFYKSKDAFVEWFDADKIVGDIEIRCRKDGDLFWPIGAKTAKKTARFLIDAQLDLAVKKSVFVVVDAKKTLWIAPIRMSEQVKISPKTMKLLEIKLRQERT